MLIRHRGKSPDVDASALVVPTAVVAGRVRIGAKSRVMFGAVLDSEASSIELGECVIVCANAVLRATASGNVEYPLVVGDHVFISPHSTLIGCTVKRCSYVATGATVLQGARVESGAAVAVGGFVHAGTVVPAGGFVPPNAIAIGDPMRLYDPSDPAALAEAVRSVGFAARAFGASAEWSDRLARYTEATEVRSAEFGAHLDDEIVEG